MKNLYYLITALILFTTSCPFTAKTQFALSNLPDWENPKVIGINKEPAHASFIPYPDVQSALADSGLTCHSPFYQSLDGKWKFK